MFRGLWRKRTFSFLNIAGLAVGIAVSLLIFLVIHYETSYDGYQSKLDRIYRVVTEHSKRSNGEWAGYEGSVPFPLTDAMRLEHPGLEKLSAVWNVGGAQIHVPGKELSDEKVFKEDNGLFFAEPSFFEIFDYEWLEGNASGLTEPNTAVLNQSVASAYFGDWRKAIGKTIQMWSFRIPFRIVGVFKDLPDNTDMQVRIGESYATFKNINPLPFIHQDAWGSAPWSSESYVLAAKGQDRKSLEARLPAFVDKHYTVEREHSLNKTTLHFQPLKDLHLEGERYSTFKGDALTVKELWTLGLIGLFLLIVACINFINLATAQSVNRAKEIGVRKVLGSNRSGLLRQFLKETAVITFLSLVMGCFIAALALPALKGLMHKELALDLWHNSSILLFLLVTGVMVTLLAGFYPGMILSGFNPITAIKSKISTKTIGGISLRRGLVVLQFVIAQLLVIGTLVVVRQMKFFRNQPMGFEKKAVALLDLPSDSTDRLRYNYLKTSLLQVPGVQAASFCGDAPASWGGESRNFYFGNDPVMKDFAITVQMADSGYLNTFRIGLVAGRQPFASDTMREVLLNETAVKKLGYKDPKEVLGKMFSFDKDRQKFPVVGVMRDFSSKSLREAVAPLVLSSQEGYYGSLAMRFDPEKMKETMEQVRKIFTATYPYYVYDLGFIDERIERFYNSEAMTSQLFKTFAFLAIFISCLGLYGLVSFMTVQKTKEVGIRKVLGASVGNIVYLFSREFTILLGIAFLIAAPLGYYFMQGWLSRFYYHVALGWEVFALAIVLSVVIAWITVGYKAVKAAVVNPVKSLRSE